MPHRANYPSFSGLKLPNVPAASRHRAERDEWQAAERAALRWQIALVAVLGILAVAGAVLIIFGLTK